jgi:spore coat protein CotH
MRKTFLLLFISIAALSQTPSKLPIITIETFGNTIVDEPKVMASMKVFYNENGAINNVNDSPNYSGKIGIEFRGSSSQSFPKKPYGFETWDAEGNEIDTTFFGWPAESDWILFASYNEKSLMHNVLTLRMAESMGLYASRTKYVELYVNSEYLGVYVFMEKVKRSKGRVDIAKLKPEEETGNNLTGGYIIKIDKNTGSNNSGWFSSHSNQTQFFKPTEFFYEYPKSITSVQENYIREYIKSFETVLLSNDFTDPDDGYQKYIDMKSFVLMTILNEVSKNVDGYRISTFLYKDKGEKLKMGPPWDYDISYGNANYCRGNSFEGFSYNFNSVCPDDNWQVPFWWNRFLGDVNFIREFRSTYEDLRLDGILQESEIQGFITEMSTELKDAQKRNFNKWPILGRYVWPQPEPIATTWEGEVDELKKWIGLRLQWLDNNIPREMAILAIDNEPVFKVTAYPNPFLETLSVELMALKSCSAQISISDLLGREIINQKHNISEGRNQLNLRFPENHSSQTIQLLKVEMDGMVVIQKVLRQ